MYLELRKGKQRRIESQSFEIGGVKRRLAKPKRENSYLEYIPKDIQILSV